MSFRPIRNKILIRKRSEPTTSPGGIIIPDTAVKPSLEADVLAVGPDVKDVRVGDRVWVTRFGGKDARLEGESLMVVLETDIMAVAE